MASEDGNGLPFNLQDYLHLFDWSGRCVRNNKRRAIDENVPAILTLLGIAADEWLPKVTAIQHLYELVMDSPEKMKAHAESRGGSFYRGYRQELLITGHLNKFKWVSRYLPRGLLQSWISSLCFQ